MPLFDFTCPNCGYEFEAITRGWHEGTSHCPECGTPAKRNLVQKPGLRIDHTWD